MNAKIPLPKTNGHLKQIQHLAKTKENPPPIATLIGFDVVEVEHAHTVFTMQAEKRHANPMGTLHGGILCDLGDAAMGMAMATTLEDDESFTSLDITIKFFKPVWNAKLTATADVVKRSRQLGLVECEVTDEKGSLVAKLYSQCMVLRGDEAKGR
ncbi:MAG TPA: PaaI family thioesterase [Polyangiaceae bacterium]